jgi:hypothetical protein
MYYSISFKVLSGKTVSSPAAALIFFGLKKEFALLLALDLVPLRSYVKYCNCWALWLSIFFWVRE